MTQKRSIKWHHFSHITIRIKVYLISNIPCSQCFYSKQINIHIILIGPTCLWIEIFIYVKLEIVCRSSNNVRVFYLSSIRQQTRRYYLLNLTLLFQHHQDNWFVLCGLTSKGFIYKQDSIVQKYLEL